MATRAPLPPLPWSLFYQAECNDIMRERGLMTPDAPVFTGQQLAAMGHAQRAGISPEQFVDSVTRRSCVA